MAHQVRQYRQQARALRAQETRERLLTAAREWFLREPFDAIRLADIARDAATTTQTLHTHFGDKASLFEQVARRLGEELGRDRATVPEGDVPAMVAALMRGYERFGDANWRLVSTAERVPNAADLLQGARREHRAWLATTLGRHLPAEPHRRAVVLDALYAATDVGTWKLLRRDLGLSKPRTAAAMQALIRGALRDPTGTEEVP